MQHVRLVLVASKATIELFLQDLVVLYRSEDGELCDMWIAPDRQDHGGDPQKDRAALEGSELFASFLALVQGHAGGAAVDVSYQSFL